MPVVEHNVSSRNGSQVMVRGMRPSLRSLGYCRGARVAVSDPTGSLANDPWVFVVANDEDATLVSQTPPPPSWIQPGVRIRIDVASPLPPSEVATQNPEGVKVPLNSEGRLHTVRLVLEIIAIAVTVVSGIVALIWRFK